MQLARPNHDELQQNEDGAHHLTIVQLAHLVQLVAKQELEDKEQAYDKETPEGSEESIPELSVHVLPDEYDYAKVGIKTITDEEGWEDDEPGNTSRKKISFNLEYQQDREDGEADQPDPDLKDWHP